MLKRLKEDKLNFAKNGKIMERDSLSFVLSESIKKAVNDPKNPRKEPTDVEILKVIEELVKANCETIDNLVANNRLADTEKYRIENEFLENYLPQKMSESELIETLKKCFYAYFLADGQYRTLDNSTTKRFISIGMKYLKENFAGRYDSQAASEIAKNIDKYLGEKV